MASSYQFIEPGAAFPGVSATGTVQLMRLGLIAGAHDPTFGYAEFMYVRGSSNSVPTAGDGCLIDGAYRAQQLVSGNTVSRGPVGLAPAALSATNVFGWVQVMGVADFVNMGTQGTTAAGFPVVVGTTAGRLQTTAGATGFLINGLYVSQYSTTANSNSGILFAYYPVYDGRNQ